MHVGCMFEGLADLVRAWRGPGGPGEGLELGLELGLPWVIGLETITPK